MIEDFMFKSHVELSDKEHLLSLLHGEKVSDDGQHISLTDWHLDSERPYISALRDIIWNHNKELALCFGYDNVDVISIWFQQYHHMDRHPRHVHGECSFSNIFYLELPEQTKTQFWHRNKRYDISVRENDILSFPGLIPHASPPNNSNERKTVIVWNSNVNIV